MRFRHQPRPPTKSTAPAAVLGIYLPEDDRHELGNRFLGSLAQLLTIEALHRMGHFSPAGLAEPAQLPGGLQHTAEAVSADQHRGDAPCIKLDSVEQTARRAAPSIAVGEDYRVTPINIAPFVGAHYPSRVVRASLGARNAIPLTEDDLHLVEQLGGIDLLVDQNPIRFPSKVSRRGASAAFGSVGSITGSRTSKPMTSPFS